MFDHRNGELNVLSEVRLVIDIRCLEGEIVMIGSGSLKK